MKKFLFFAGALSLFAMGTTAQTRISLFPGQNTLKVADAQRGGFTLVNDVAFIDVDLDKLTQGEYVALSMEGYGNTMNVGFPELPAMSQLFEMPIGAKAEVEVLSYDEIVLNLADYDIYKQIVPAQASVSKSADPSKIIFEINPEVYASDALFSNPIVRCHESGIMRGVQLGRVEINPLAYNPVTGELRIYNNLRARVTFTGGDIAKSDALRRKLASPAFNGLMSKVINRVSTRDLNLYSTPMRFVIIADRMFEASLQPFVEWKIKQGFITEVRYTDESGIGNTTTSIKNYLAGQYDNATEANPAPSFVMLVGDVAQVPAFQGQAGSHVSDTYYGTYDGATDMIPDVNLGRMSATSAAMLDAIIAKTLEYEKFELQDPSYLDQSLLIAGVDGNYAATHGNGFINYAINYMNEAHGIQSTNYYYPASDGSSVPSEIIAKVNSGLAWGNYTAHCSPSGWADPSFITSSLSQLTQNYKYGFYIGNCCESSTYNASECFAEAITRAANKGAVGYIGASNSTYWNEDYWWATGHGQCVVNPVFNQYGPGAYDVLFNEVVDDEAVISFTAGQMNVAGCLAVEASSSSRKRYYWEIYTMMGDPTLTPYVGPMPAMEPSYLATLPIGLTSLSISNVPEHAYIALSYDGEIIAAGFANNGGECELTFDSFTAPVTADLVITAPFHQPFIGTLDAIPSNAPFVVYHAAAVNGVAGNMVDYGQSATLSIDVKNVGSVGATGVTATLTTESEYVTIVEGTAEVGNVAPEAVISLTDAFAITVAPNVPDQERLRFTLTATDGSSEPWVTNFSLTANAPVVSLGRFELAEVNGNGNGRIDAGETLTLTVPVANNGHAASAAAHATMSSTLVSVTAEGVTTSLDPIAAEGAGEFVFTVTTAAGIPVGTPLVLTATVECGGLVYEATANYFVGLVVEDFESGSFESYDWQHSTTSWTVVNADAHEGTYCAKSGDIGNNASTSLSITIDVPISGELTFYYKVSSEASYDKLNFKVDGSQAGSWSGNVAWTQHVQQVTAGSHTFEWVYTKDGSVDGGSDCAWVDYIVFPGGQTITNQAPFFTSTDVNTAVCSQLYTAQITAEDPDGDNVEISATSKPEWLTLESTGNGTATLSGVPPCQTDDRVEQVVLVASDGEFQANKVLMIAIQGDETVGIEAPAAMASFSVYPNPAHGAAMLSFDLAQGAQVRIEAYNMAGQLVRVIANQPMVAGSHRVAADLEGLTSGVYMIRMTAGETVGNSYVVVD